MTFETNDFPKVAEAIDQMLNDRWDPITGLTRLMELGVPPDTAFSLRATIRGVLDRIADLSRRADKVNEMHLMHFNVLYLVDLAYEHDLIDNDRAKAYLIQDGNTHEVADRHLEAMERIQDRDAYRAEYLDHPELDRRYCTVCGRKVPGRTLSHRGLCPNCIDEIQDAVAWQMIKKSGSYYRRWRTAMIRSMHALEDEEIAEQQPAQRADAPLILGDMIEAEGDDAIRACFSQGLAQTYNACGMEPHGDEDDDEEGSDA